MPGRAGGQAVRRGDRAGGQRAVSAGYAGRLGGVPQTPQAVGRSRGRAAGDQAKIVANRQQAVPGAT